MSGLGEALTLDAWVQMKRRYTPILICCEADRGATEALADRMNDAAMLVRPGGLLVRVEVNDLLPAGFALFKPPMYSSPGTWPLPEREQFTVVRLYPEGQGDAG